MTSLAVSSGTLLLTLAVSPYPPELRGPGVDAPIEYFGLPWAPSTRYHAFTVVTVAKAAVAQVRRVIVTQEVYEPSDPLVVDVPVHRGVARAIGFGARIFAGSTPGPTVTGIPRVTFPHIDPTRGTNT